MNAIFGVVGWKNSGKTGLMERLVTEITGRGLTVSTVKHVSSLMTSILVYVGQFRSFDRT